MALQTRKPSGQAGFPSIIVEGKEGAGKTHNLATLTADPRIGRSYLVEVGERRLDEYAALGNFDLVEHDGRLQTIVPSILDVMALPPVDGKPTLLGVDSGTSMWDLVKRYAEGIGRSSKRARQILEEDPDAEIEIGHQAWNRATDRWWWSWLEVARSWHGILVITARADEVSKFENGHPVKNQTEYRVDIQKGTPFAVDGTCRIRLGAPALLTTVKSLKIPKLPAGGMELPDPDPLPALIFDMLGAGTLITLTMGKAKQSMVAHARVLGVSDEQEKDGPPSPAKQVAARAWKAVVKNDDAFVGDGPTMSMLVDAVEVEVAALGQATQKPPSAPQGAESATPMTELLSKRLHALLRAKRGAQGDARFPVLTELAGREITSSKQLSQDEGIAICDILAAEPELPKDEQSAARKQPERVDTPGQDEATYVPAEVEHDGSAEDVMSDAEADDIVGALVLAVLDLTPVQVQAQLMKRHETPPATVPDQMRRLVALQAGDQGVAPEQVDRFYAEAGA